MRLPHTASVMPNAVGEGVVVETSTRGSGFTALPGGVKFGTADAASVTRDSDTLIRATPPATLAPGSYKVDLSMPPNALGLNRERARLAVVNTATTITQAEDIPLPIGPKYAAVFDDARLTLYVANVVDAAPAAPAEIERLRWNGAGWTADSLAVPFLRDLAMAPGGDELLALTSSAVVRVDPDTWAVIDTVNVPSPGGVPNRSFAVGNDGRVLISQATNIGVSTNITYFDLYAGGFTDEFVCCISGNIRATGDGAALYLVGDSPIRRYDVKTRTYTDGGPTSMGGRVLSVARAGARVVVDGTHVYNADLSPRGTLSVGGGEILTAAAITPDGTRAYAYGASGTLYKFDLETFNGTGGFAQMGAGTPLPHLVASAVMTMSVDSRTVFIAGDDRVIVKPVPP
jgi:hypothetical protein